MKRLLFYTAALLAALTVGSTQQAVNAAVITNAVENGNIVTDFSEDGELDFDISFLNFDGVLFDVTASAGEGGTLAFSALFDNFTGTAFRSSTINLLGGPTFSQFNMLDPTRATASGLGTSTLMITFNPALRQGRSLTIGRPSDDLFNPPAIDSDLDFFIDLNGAREFSVSANSMAVPEPSAIVIFALGIVGYASIGVNRQWRCRRRKTSADNMVAGI